MKAWSNRRTNSNGQHNAGQIPRGRRYRGHVWWNQPGTDAGELVDPRLFSRSFADTNQHHAAHFRQVTWYRPREIFVAINACPCGRFIYISTILPQMNPPLYSAEKGARRRIETLLYHSPISDFQPFEIRALCPFGTEGLFFFSPFFLFLFLR